MIFNLDGRHRVRVTSTKGGAYKFEEYTFGPDGRQVIGDTYHLEGDEAVTKLEKLAGLDALRFGAQFGRPADKVQAVYDLESPVEDPWKTPHPDSHLFDMHRVLGEFARGTIDVGVATRNLEQIVQRETFGQVAHHLSDINPGNQSAADVLAELAEFYGEAARGE